MNLVKILIRIVKLQILKNAINRLSNVINKITDKMFNRLFF